MDKITLEKSNFYKGGPMEEVFFYVHHEGDKISLGNGQDIYGRLRDESNLYNIVSEINEASQDAYDAFDATVFSSSTEAMQKINEYLLTTPYTYDAEKTSSELEEFVRIEKKLQDSWNYDICLRQVKDVSTRAIEGMPEDIKQNCLGYIRDVIAENVLPTGKKVKTIDARRSIGDKMLGKNKVGEFTAGFFHNLEYSIGLLKGTPYIENVYELFEEGFPKEVNVKEEKKANEEIRMKINSTFPREREDKLRTSLLNKYAFEHIRGAMQLKYYEETKDLSIFLTAKEQEEFKSMSFAELKEKYGTELVTTHKGAVLATLKLHQEKKEGKTLKESLEAYTSLIKEARKEANFDMGIRRYIFDEISKDYQKFAPNDMEYRAVVEALAPSKTEIASINGYQALIEEKRDRVSQDNIARLDKIRKMQLQFTHDSDIIITGKIAKSDLEEAKARITGKKKEETVSQAIQRVKAKHKEDRKTGDHVSGVVIADDISERLKEGFELPKEKKARESVATNLRKKRALIEK